MIRLVTSLDSTVRAVAASKFADTWIPVLRFWITDPDCRSPGWSATSSTITMLESHLEAAQRSAGDVPSLELVGRIAGNVIFYLQWVQTRRYKPRKLTDSEAQTLTAAQRLFTAVTAAEHP